MAKKSFMRKTNQMKYKQRSLNADLARPLHEKVRSFLKSCLFVDVKSIITSFLEQLFVVLVLLTFVSGLFLFFFFLPWPPIFYSGTDSVSTKGE